MQAESRDKLNMHKFHNSPECSHYDWAYVTLKAEKQSKNLLNVVKHFTTCCYV